MKRVVLMALALSAVISLVGLGIFCRSGKDTAQPIQRHIKYGFTLQNTTNRLLKQAELWTYAPVKRTATQTCNGITASHPFDLSTDPNGNQILHFMFDGIPPYGVKIVDIQADVVLYAQPVQMPSESAAVFLSKEKYMELDDPGLMKLGKSLSAGGASRTAEKTFHWVASNIRYTGYARADRGALYALRHREGDCSEYMYLMAALCRINGIPARGIAGYVCPSDMVLKPASFHNWAEIYLNGTWQIADAQRKVFMKEAPQYVAMRIITNSPDQTEKPAGEFNRFRYAGDGLKVEMNN